MLPKLRKPEEFLLWGLLEMGKAGRIKKVLYFREQIILIPGCELIIRCRLLIYYRDVPECLLATPAYATIWPRCVENNL